MYEPKPPEGDLEQGDVCLGVALPVMTSGAKWQGRTDGSLASCPPSSNDRPLVYWLQVSQGPVVVVSQSCDLVGLDEHGAERILVCQAFPDHDDRFVESYKNAKALDDHKNKIAAALVAGASGNKNEAGKAEKALEKAEEAHKRVRLEALKKLWRGDLTGAFPLLNSASLPRSVCYFDTIVSVPASWVGMLKESRSLRLNATWKSVLQESLARWLGRYAYPGTMAERLQVGLGAELNELSEE